MNDNDIIRLDMTFRDLKELLIYCSNHPEPETKKLEQLLIDKLQRIVNRELYSTYKTSKSDEEREAARQKYLENRGIPAKYRW